MKFAKLAIVSSEQLAVSSELERSQKSSICYLLSCYLLSVSLPAICFALAPEPRPQTSDPKIPPRLLRNLNFREEHRQPPIANRSPHTACRLSSIAYRHGYRGPERLSGERRPYRRRSIG